MSEEFGSGNSALWMGCAVQLLGLSWGYSASMKGSFNMKDN